MSIFSARCLFVVALICTEGAVAKNLQGSLGHKFSKRDHSTNHQENECSMPQSCKSLFDLEPTSDLNDTQLAAINQAYSENCIPSCINPMVAFYHCLSKINTSLTPIYNYEIELLQNGICGQESGEYCPVLFARQNRTNSDAFGQLDTTCNYGNTGITCNSTTSATCFNGLTKIASLIGCCTRPYFGSGIDSCTGVTSDPPCNTYSPPSNSPANRVYPFAALSIIAVVFLGFNL